MKFFLFKLFLKAAIRLAPCKEVAHTFDQRLLCLERERQMQECVRPRSDMTKEYIDNDLEQ